jgi:hypothetical protein
MNWDSTFLSVLPQQISSLSNNPLVLKVSSFDPNFSFSQKSLVFQVLPLVTIISPISAVMFQGKGFGKDLLNPRVHIQVGEFLIRYPGNIRSI